MIDGKHTYWNGESCEATLVRTVVGKSPRPTWWCADMEGDEIEAIRVEYQGSVFYIQDSDEARFKLTAGRGSPQWPHRSVPVACDVLGGRGR